MYVFEQDQYFESKSINSNLPRPLFLMITISPPCN